MSEPGSKAGDHDASDEALRQYEEEKEASKVRIRRELIERHPELAQYLQDFFEGEDLFDLSLQGDDQLLQEVRAGLDSASSEAETADDEELERDPAPDIGGFRIGSRLGQGGMGTVFKARELEADRDVALKVMRTRWRPFPALLNMFANEARAAAGLSHTGIVKVYRVGLHAGLPYYTMELAQGGTLEDRLEEHRGDYVWVATMLATVADAIGHEHSQGFLHRDIKPSNILFDEDERPMVADFGLAMRIERGAHERYLDERGLGTPAFMAPELAGEEPAPPSVASDIWGLGAVLYYALARVPPVPGAQRTEVLENLAALRAADASMLPQDVPADLSAICLKCLSIDPGGRYRHAGDLAQDLRRFLAGRETSARPLSLWHRAVYWFRRKPWAAALVVLGLAVAVAALVAARLAARGQAQQRLSQARDLRVRADAAAESGYVAEAGLLYAESYRLAPSRAARCGLLAHQTPVPVAIFRPRAGSIWRLAYDPAGRYLAAATHSGRVLVWAVDSREVVADLAHEGGSVRALAFDAKGVRIATGDQAGTLWLFDVMTGTIVAEARVTDGAPHDGGAGRDVHGVGFGGTGDVVIAGGKDGYVRRWHPGRGEETWRAYPSESRADIRSIAVGPRQRYALIGVGGISRNEDDDRPHGEARWYDIEEDRFLSPVLPHWETAWSAAIAPNGEWVVTSDDTGLRFYDRDGRTRREPIRMDSAVGTVALDPTARFLLTGDTTRLARLWDVRTELAVGRPLPHGGAVYAAVFEPGGRRVATAGEDGVVRVWGWPGGTSDRIRWRSVPPLWRIAAGGGDEVLGHPHDLHELVLFDARTRRERGRARLSDRVLASEGYEHGWWIVTAGSSGPALRVARVEVGELTFGEPVRIPMDGDVSSAQLRDGGRVLCLIRPGRTGAEIWTRATPTKYVRRITLARSAGLALGSKGRFLATTEDGRNYQIWDVALERPVRSCHVEGAAQRVGVGLGGTRVAAIAAGARSVVLWDAESDRLIKSIPHDDVVSTLFFLRGDQVLATVGGDGKIRFWDASDATPLGAPLVHLWNTRGRARPATVQVARAGPVPEAIVSLVGLPDDQRELYVWRVPWLAAFDDVHAPVGYLDRARLTALHRVTDDGRFIPLDDPAWRALRRRWAELEGR